MKKIMLATMPAALVVSTLGLGTLPGNAEEVSKIYKSKLVSGEWVNDGTEVTGFDFTEYQKTLEEAGLDNGYELIDVNVKLKNLVTGEETELGKLSSFNKEDKKAMLKDGNVYKFALQGVYIIVGQGVDDQEILSNYEDTNYILMSGESPVKATGKKKVYDAVENDGVWSSVGNELDGFNFSKYEEELVAAGTEGGFELKDANIRAINMEDGSAIDFGSLSSFDIDKISEMIEGNPYRFDIQGVYMLTGIGVDDMDIETEYKETDYVVIVPENKDTNEPPSDNNIPLTPLEPSTPIEKPSVPLTPLEPSTPIEKPSVPLTPLEPSTPIEKPSVPLTPLEPSTPIEKPSEPLTPLEPSNPIKKPSEPSIPIEKPLEPSNPIEKPSEPSKPTEPPTEPTPPVEPTEKPEKQETTIIKPGNKVPIIDEEDVRVDIEVKEDEIEVTVKPKEDMDKVDIIVVEKDKNKEDQKEYIDKAEDLKKDEEVKIDIPIKTDKDKAYTVIIKTPSKDYESGRIEVADGSPLWKYEDVKSREKVSAYDAIYEATRLGIVEGDTIDGLRYFKPNANVTRAQITAMILRSLGIEYEDYKGKPFKDTKNKWYQGAVGKARDLGIVNGFTEDEFRGDDYITREHLTAMLKRAYVVKSYESPTNNFIDVEDTRWTFSSVNTLYDLEAIKGYDDGTFRPKNNATRAQSVTMITGILGSDSKHVDLVKYKGVEGVFLDVLDNARNYGVVKEIKK